MSDNDETIRTMDVCRSASGEIGEVSAIMESVAASVRARNAPDLDNLIQNLLIPGVLCPAAPKVVIELLELFPSCNSKTKLQFLRIIVALAEVATVADHESAERYSGGAIEPYANYESLRTALIRSIGQGGDRYRLLFTSWKSTLKESHVLAGALLSFCENTTADLLDRYHAALAATNNHDWQLRLLTAARRVANRFGIESQYLKRHINSDIPLMHVISSAWLSHSLSDDFLQKAMEQVIQVRNISLTEILSGVNGPDRIRIYEAVFRSPKIISVELLSYCIDMLRASFDESVKVSSVGYSPTEARRPYDIHYSFTSPPHPEIIDISPLQRRVLIMLVQRDEIWQNRTNIWRQFGLPETREAIRELLA